ncbi:MAG TPA: hypothetical protein VKP30_10855, partial [Polyangiaceae bacterium]|nr:hypothetical protein [Polyangiaceae bacterium]
MDTDLAAVGPILVKLGTLNASGPEMTSEPIGDLSELVGPTVAVDEDKRVGAGLTLVVKRSKGADDRDIECPASRVMGLVIVQSDAADVKVQVSPLKCARLPYPHSFTRQEPVEQPIVVRNRTAPKQGRIFR